MNNPHSFTWWIHQANNKVRNKLKSNQSVYAILTKEGKENNLFIQLNNLPSYVVCVCIEGFNWLNVLCSTLCVHTRNLLCVYFVVSLVFILALLVLLAPKKHLKRPKADDKCKKEKFVFAQECNVTKSAVFLPLFVF